jgi:hypothetical protein
VFFLFICSVELDAPVGLVVLSVVVFPDSETSVLGLGLVVVGVSVFSSVVAGVTDFESGWVELALMGAPGESLTVLGDLLGSLSVTEGWLTEGWLVSLSVSVDFPDPLMVSEVLLVSLSRSLKPVEEDWGDG